MYEHYYGLHRPAFAGSTDEPLIYQASAQQDALGRLHYAIERHRPFAVLVGEAGVGKSVLVERLSVRMSDAGHRWTRLTYPLLEPSSLLSYLDAEWTQTPDPVEAGGRSEHATRPNAVGGTESDPGSTAQLVRRLTESLHREAASRRTVLLIDDAHLIDRHTPEPDRIWETLRLLTGLTGPRQAGVTVLLVGRTILLPILRTVPALTDQLDTACVLRAFDEAETAAYVSHRLRAAGASRTIFDPSALTALYQATGGIARRIDRVADLTLLVGYAEECPTIGAAHVEAVAADLARGADLPHPGLPSTRS